METSRHISKSISKSLRSNQRRELSTVVDSLDDVAYGAITSYLQIKAGMWSKELDTIIDQTSRVRFVKYRKLLRIQKSVHFLLSQLEGVNSNNYKDTMKPLVMAVFENKVDLLKKANESYERQHQEPSAEIFEKDSPPELGSFD